MCFKKYYMAYSIEEKEIIFNDIIKKISGGLSLRKSIEELNTISRETFFEWIAKDKELADQYARATEVRADAIFEEIFDIADDGTNDWVEKFDKQGESFYDLNGEHIQRSKLRIDARKWALSKMQPKKYGDKLDLTSGNEKINSVQPMTPELIDKIVNVL